MSEREDTLVSAVLKMSRLRLKFSCYIVKDSTLNLDDKKINLYILYFRIFWVTSSCPTFIRVTLCYLEVKIMTFNLFYLWLLYSQGQTDWLL